MKKILKHLFLSIFILTNLYVSAQKGNGLLWKISGNGLEKPSYVFGTIHMICNEDYVMTPTIENTLSSADAFYAEINFADADGMTEMQASLMSKVPLSKRIDLSTYEKLKSLLKETVDLDIATLETISDAGIASMVTIKSFPCTEYKMYEIEFLKAAMLQNKKLGGLETVREQVDLMNKSMDIDATIKMLQDLKQEGVDGTKQMVELYRNQNINGLLDFMNESSYMNKEVYYEMLTKRNQNWLIKMPEIMQKQSTFFAVGAAHLGGSEGILQLLSNIGFEVTPVNIQ